MNNLQKPIQVGKDIFIAPTATVIGDVSLGDEVSIWFGAVLRGDSDKISVGARTNIQDNAVIHCDPNDPAVIGEECIIGHCAIVHGAKLANNVLVGMNATVLNNAEIGEFSIIGANALVTAGTIIPPYSLVLGSPAKVVKKLSDDQVEGIRINAKVYVDKAKEYLAYYQSKET
ncbi:MAG: carbonic anhydrase/acetyltransferase-like protein (isoleucine patch superfamily) [Bacteroidia bacterium]|jgi:carbonic anhydrase/acetyltransferase-like protein (isoleucine patch superfamily)